MSFHNPLTADDLRQINASLDTLKQADETIKRAEMAGIDVSSQKAEAKEARSRLIKLKNAFFPNN